MKHKPHVKRPLTYHSKLMLVNVAMLLLPLLTMSLLLFSQQRQAQYQRLLAEESQTLQQISAQMNIELSQIGQISNLYYFDTKINELLRDSDIPSDEQALRHLMTRYNAGFRPLSFQLAFIGTNGKVFGNAAHIEQLDFDKVQNTDWYQEALTNNAELVWCEDTVLDQAFTDDGSPYFFAARQINNFSVWRSLGVMVIGFPQYQMERLFRTVTRDGNAMFVLSASGELLAKRDNIGLAWSELSQQLTMAGRSGSSTVCWEGQELIVGYDTIAMNNWRVIRVSSLSRYLARAGRMYMIGALLLVIVFSGSFLSSYLITRRFVRPVEALERSMELVKQGDFDVRAQIGSRDEIGRLAEQFNDMTGQIKHLMAETYEREKQKREAELSSMQNQISPHFIYNTLASVRYMVHLDDRERADTAIVSLIRLLKDTLSGQDEIVPVCDELALLRSYIDIQRMLDDSFTVTYQISDTVLDCLIIKLLLQPIVENAIHHGLRPARRRGSLLIGGMIRDQYLCFVIEDDGVGIDPARSRDPDEMESSFGIGLKNVHDRIRLHFGEEYGLQIEARQEGGTRVTVSLPVLENDGEVMEYRHSDC